MHYRRMAPHPRKRQSCIKPIIILALIMLLVGVGSLLFIRPGLGAYIGLKVGQQFGIDGLNEPAQTHSSSPQQGMQEQLEQAVPTTIAALPEGEIVVTEQRVNAYLATNPQALGPIDSATVHFVPSQVQVDIEAIGTHNRITSGLAVQNGRIVMLSPKLDGPLGMVLSFDDMVQSLETEINNQLNTQGRTIHDIRIEQGQIVVIIE